LIKPCVDGSDATRLPYLRLGAAALYRAIQDVRHESDEVALDALFWLCLDQTPRMILELLHFEADNPAILFSKGLPDVIKARPTGRKLGKKYKDREVKNE